MYPNIGNKDDELQCPCAEAYILGPYIDLTTLSFIVRYWTTVINFWTLVQIQNIYIHLP